MAVPAWSRSSAGSSAATVETITSGAQRGPPNPPSRTDVPGNSAARASARSRERFMTIVCAMLRSRSCETTCSLMAPAPRTSAVVLAQFAEDALRQLYSRGSDRHRPGAKLGLVAHALTDFERALKHPVQHRTGRALFVRKAVRFADLAQDFGFAEHHRIKAGGYAKQVADCVSVIVLVERHA